MIGPRVAIIGSGPAGLYTCSRLLQKLPMCRVDVFDRNPVPYGLVYYGVAPDHVDMKKCLNQFERMFSENANRLSLFCNVSVGADVKYEELCERYETVVLAYGANKARTLRLKNENAINCFSGSDFVSWYNGQPKSSASPILDGGSAIVIGNGNVAIDCSRILLSSMEKLSHTDVPEYALKTLQNSRMKHVKILGRRGPIEASFTIKELRELLNLDGCSSSCVIPDSVLRRMDEAIKGAERPRKRLLELMCSRTTPNVPQEVAEKRCEIEFYHIPQRILVDGRGRVSELEVRIAVPAEKEVVRRLPCDLLIYAIGFENILLPGLPRTDDNRLKMLDWCRVPCPTASVYATGWCAHAARGVIAESQQQAFSVVDQLVDDWTAGRVEPKSGVDAHQETVELLRSRQVRYVNWDDWCYIDECERRMGALLGKPREKLHDMITLLNIRDR